MNATITSMFPRNLKPKALSSPAAPSPNVPGQAVFPGLAQRVQQKSTQPTGAISNISQNTSNTPGPIPNTVAHHLRSSNSSVDDFMLLCSDEKGWLTTRDDLNVSNVKSDKELFKIFRSRLRGRKSRTHRLISLRNIQRISFVQVKLYSQCSID